MTYDLKAKYYFTQKLGGIKGSVGHIPFTEGSNAASKFFLLPIILNRMYQEFVMFFNRKVRIMYYISPQIFTKNTPTFLTFSSLYRSVQ